MEKLPYRPRRLRKTKNIRALFEESQLRKDDLITPIFVTGDKNKSEIKGLPHIFRTPLVDLKKEADDILTQGGKAVMLFPVIPKSQKSLDAKESFNTQGLLPQAITILKKHFKELVLFADVALDPYTSHGHDGIVDESSYVLNDETVTLLSKQALCLAEAGVDFVAPSDMMDGRVKHIRSSLDSKGYSQTGILSYASKFASSFYGPFREALGSTHLNIDKKSYQLETQNKRQAIYEAKLDIQEGADILMIKPGTLCLDIISEIKKFSDLPLAAYHVSGEYAMMKAAAEKGWIDEGLAVQEVFKSLKRAGADLIVSYYAKWAFEHCF